MILQPRAAARAWARVFTCVVSNIAICQIDSYVFLLHAITITLASAGATSGRDPEETPRQQGQQEWKTFPFLHFLFLLLRETGRTIFFRYW